MAFGPKTSQKQFSSAAPGLAAAVAAISTLAGGFNAAQAEPSAQPVRVAMNNHQSLKTVSEETLATLAKTSVADTRAMIVSLQKPVVGVGIKIGKDSKGNGLQAGEAIKQMFLDEIAGTPEGGVPSKYEIDIVPGAGIEVTFYVDGNAHMDELSANGKSTFTGRSSIQQIPAVAAEFRRKHPEALIRPASLALARN